MSNLELDSICDRFNDDINNSEYDDDIFHTREENDTDDDVDEFDYINEKFFQDTFNEWIKNFKKNKKIKLRFINNNINNKKKYYQSSSDLQKIIDEKMFFGFCFYFWKTKELSSDWVNILKKLIIKRNGRCVTERNDSVTHIVIKGDYAGLVKSVCKEKQFKKIKNNDEKKRKVKEVLDKVKIIEPGWISEMVTKRHGGKMKRYEVQSTAIEMIEIDEEGKRKRKRIGNDDGEDSAKMKKKRKKSEEEIEEEYRRNLACQKPRSIDNIACINQDIVDLLEEIKSSYENVEDWKHKAYSKVILEIKNMDKKIIDADKLLKIKGIGKSVVEHIQEFIDTGGISTHLINLKNNEQYNFYREVGGIHGVGKQTLEKWWTRGFRSFEDVKNNADLNETQKIGLKYYYDLLKKIPRDEVEEITVKVKNVCLAINPNLSVICCGSFRRKKKLCGDVDILITDEKEENKRPIGLLAKILNVLRNEKMIIATINESKDLHLENDEKAQDTFQGICRIREFARRLDIKVYARECFPFAMLYFTGSAYFNRSMRYHAKDHLGWTLSDKALRPAIRVKGKKIEVLEKFICRNEKEIFEKLGLKYIPPEERNI